MSEITDKEFRTYVTTRAKQGQFWEQLKDLLASKADLTSQLKSLRQEIARSASEAKARAVKADREVTEIINDATARAGDIVKAAQVSSAEAETAKTTAELALESARAEAHDIIEKAKGDAKRTTALIAELRGMA